MSIAEKCRNFVIAGHCGSGKTTLSEAMLLAAKAIPRAGNIESRSTVSDFMSDEQERQSSIYASVLNCAYDDCHYYWVDTPGYGEFVGQYISAVRAADAALVIVDAVEGPQFGTARAWRLAKARGIPRFGFVNRLDRDRADFKATIEKMRRNHGRTVIIPLYWPVGSAEKFERVVSVFADDVPPEIAEDVAECRALWMDAIAETSEELMERYLDGQELSADEIKAGLRNSVRSGSTIPVFMGSAVTGVGIKELMDGIRDFFPTPLEYVPLTGGPASVSESDSPFGIVFKSVNDPFSGQLAFVRVVSGVFKADTDIANVSRQNKEHLGQLLLMNGKAQTPTAEAGLGTIFAVAKLKDTHVGDTLAGNMQIKPLPGIAFPEPVMSYAVTAARSGEDEKIAQALHKIVECDPTVRISRNEETHEFLLSGMGDQHLGLVSKRLKDQFKVEAELNPPKIPYRETITAPGDGHYRHKKQTGGAGQFAEVYLRILPNISGYEFVNEVVGGTVPKNFIPAIEKGINDIMETGPLVGCRMQNIRIAVYDGKYHPVDSNEMAFRIAGRMAFRDAIAKAKPVLLEPVMRVNIAIPDVYLGEITGDLNHKRGRVIGMTMDEGTQIVQAEVPLAEMSRYATELRSMTQGRGTFEMNFERYEQVPGNVAQEIISKHQSTVQEEN